MTRIWRNCRKR